MKAKKAKKDEASSLKMLDNALTSRTIIPNDQPEESTGAKSKPKTKEATDDLGSLPTKDDSSLVSS